MNYALWAVQILLALAFMGAGVMKTFTPIPELVANGMAFAESMPLAARVAGVSEILGSLGLILPAATRIRPILTPAAAIGLMTVMVLAAILHISRGEFGGLPPNVVLGGLAAFVAYGRLRLAPIADRAAT